MDQNQAFNAMSSSQTYLMVQLIAESLANLFSGKTVRDKAEALAIQLHKVAALISYRIGNVGDNPTLVKLAARVRVVLQVGMHKTPKSPVSFVF